MKHKNLKVLLAAMAVTAASALTLQAQESTDYQFLRTAAPTRTAAFQTDFTQAAEKAVNSVVSIKNFVSRRQQQYYDPFGGSDFFDPFEFFFGQPQQRQQQPRQRSRKQSDSTKNTDLVQAGSGSGVIISTDGYIITNNHVIDGADKIEVVLNDNRSFEAKIIGTDEMTDLALIKIDEKGLDPLTFGDSDALKVGEWVLAVGNPFGFNSTVTAGIVSAKARSISSGKSSTRLGLDSYIQTDAALNPGNSGGALVNLQGDLVGINSAIYSNTGSYTGFSFAIPSSVVQKIIADLHEYGTVQRAVLGITFIPLDADLAKEKEIKNLVAGLYVNSVADRSTALELGLEEGDVITKVNGVTTHTSAQLVEQMNKMRPGDTITVTYVRDGKTFTKSATIKNDRGDTEVVKKDDFTSLGCAFMKVSDETRKHLGISGGVQVTGLKGGKMKEAGIKEGFIITASNDTPVRTADDVEYLYDQIMRSSDQDKVMFVTGLYTTGKKGYYAVNLAED